MSSKAQAGKKIDGDSSNGKLLDEIEAISKALYMDRTPSVTSISQSTSRSSSISTSSQPRDPKSKPKNENDDVSQKEKKSFWNWGPLRAFSHVRNRRFNCCFTLQVHGIEGLPNSFDGLSLCVHWKRRDGSLVTRPAKVFQGIAEFEENLMHTCSVYGSRSGPHSSAKYEAKHFLLYVAVFGTPEVDFGKHRVDLTRLLPLTLEELDEDKNSGKWTTSFRLSGKAKGASLNVSFGYLVLGGNATTIGKNQSIPDRLRSKQNELKPGARFNKVVERNSIHRGGSLPCLTIEEVKDLHEVLPVSRSELPSPVSTMYPKLEEEEEISEYSVGNKQALDDRELIRLTPCDLDADSKDIGEAVSEVNDFSVVEQGVEFLVKELVISEEVIMDTTDVSIAASHDVVEVTGDIEEKVEPTIDDFCNKESLLKELELALDNVADLEVAALDSPDDCGDYLEVELNCETTNKKGKRSLSLDDVTESVAGEFLSMLGIENSPSGMSSESEPESPREKLLRQFEEEALASGYSLFDFDEGDEEAVEVGSDEPYVHTGFELPSPKTKAKILEDLETEALMREWGLNERAFQASPTSSSGGFGSPIHHQLPPEESIELPPLGDGLGSYLQTENGGFLRSMNPSLFRGAKSGGSLIMQASSPVVVPAEMGSEIIEILQGLASVGIEKLSMQANKLMPLEDITGKTMQQVAMEDLHSLEGIDRQHEVQRDFEAPQDVTFGRKRGKGRASGSKSNRPNRSSAGSELGSEYVSLEDLAPLALDKIEALSMEGLRIQSGMSVEEAPSNISARSIDEISALQGKGLNDLGRSLGLDGAAGLQLLDIKEGSSDDSDGLMGLSLSLSEWMKLDSGEIDDGDDQISERTSKILAAHHANSLNWIRGSKGERKRGKGSNRKCGLLGNNFTVALMVQLRDPLRNYEPVGAPMLALIQVERVFVPPKPTLYHKISEVRRDDDEDDEQVNKSTNGDEIKEGKEEEKVDEQKGIQQFKITEVHVAGLKTDPGKKKLWGNKTQQQSGSRWLLANGMGKGNKHPLMKSKPVPKASAKVDPATTKVQPGETLWSISSRVHGTGARSKELAALNPHIRNPNVIFPNKTIKLR